MPDLRQHDAVVETVAKARAEASRRPELKQTTGSRLNQINGHVYAYSGVINPSTGTETYLDFTTSSEAIKGRVEVNCDWAGGGGNNFSIQIYLNGVNIVYERDTANNYVGGDIEFHLIIPPYTQVLVDLGGSNSDCNANFTGEVI